ncbi:Alkaline phosphatase D [Pandoraea capi]|uniref:Alkaline phosphatase D n=1 Tax=Pandoraea capi TaxID=2508286 RepID=A0ABY6WC92_9BURK|nr:Alkaline phosphatase D [Pandoraea capi]
MASCIVTCNRGHVDQRLAARAAGPANDAGHAGQSRVNYFESEQRGYMRCTVTRNELLTDLRTIDFTDKPGGAVRTSKRFVIENGRTGALEI